MAFVKQSTFFLLIFFFTYSLAIEHETAFVQTEDGLHYFVDAQQLQENRGLVSAATFSRSANAVDASSAGETAQSLNQLTFDPVVLEFDKHAIGIPHLQKVTVRNPTASKVRFDAISGSTVHFHCSFFEEKQVEPGGETTFDVVFLPRQEGSIENTLFIHSSLGTFSYSVSGVGTLNPYRLRPFVGARIPLNTSFVSPVVLHNPHPTPLRITEMYSSGGDLHLELPTKSGVEDAPWNLWEIPPFQSKTVMQARFVAARERNATAYIRIKTDRQCIKTASGEPLSRDPFSSVWNQDTIVLPVEIEVTNKRGIFPAVYTVDFGFVRNDETSKMIDIKVVSNINRSIEVDSLTTEPQNDAIYFQYEQQIIGALAGLKGDRKPSTVAKAVFHGSKLKEKINGSKRVSGKIIIKSKGGKYKLSVPYSANVFHGQLLHDTQETAFYAGHSPPVEQKITMKNSFSVPLAVFNISLPRNARNTFLVKNLTKPVVIEAGKSKVVFSVQYQTSKPAPYTTFCRLYTNMSKFDLPLSIFDGKLRVSLYSIEQDQFDFGVLDFGDKRSVLFAITNENPVAITIRHSRPGMQMFTSIRLLGTEAGNETVLAHPSSDSSTAKDEWLMGEKFIIPAQSFSVFEFVLIGPKPEVRLPFSLTIQTPYETRVYPVKFLMQKGAIVSIPEKIIFQESFPGKISSQPLQVYSTFPREMPLLRLSTLSHDPRIFFESFDQSQPSPVIKPGEMSYLGRVLFFPIASCIEDCYVGLALHTNEGAWFTYGMRLPVNLPEIDAYLYQRLRKKWLEIEKTGEHIVNSTAVVDSTEVKHFQIPAEGKLVWPRLMKQSTVHFPLTAVGNFTIVNLTLHNPSNMPVVIQVLPLTIYPDPEGLLHYFKDDLPSPLTENVEINETLMFTLRDTELFNLRPDSPVPRFRQELEKAIGVQVPRFTLSMILQPNMKVRVRVGFLPKDYELRSSLLLIRNNLTVLEPVVLYGRGATVEMRVGNRLPRSAQPLLFEIQEMHLLDCQNPKRLTHRLLTTLTVRRSFVVRNTGEVVLAITTLNINGIACENRGFRILNCVPFRLKPNETHILEIAYTPDFTMSWNEGSLQLFVHGNSSGWVYPLAASLPKEWLPKCQAALPRPHWESLMYYSCVTALVFLLICIVASAYLEGDRIITCALRQQIRFRRVFDLNNLPSDDHETSGRRRDSAAQHKKLTEADTSSWSTWAAQIIQLGRKVWPKSKEEKLTAATTSNGAHNSTSKTMAARNNHLVHNKSDQKHRGQKSPLVPSNNLSRKSSAEENSVTLNSKRSKKQQVVRTSPKQEPLAPPEDPEIKEIPVTEDWEVVERPKKQHPPRPPEPTPTPPPASSKKEEEKDKKKMLRRKTSGSTRSDAESGGSSVSNKRRNQRRKKEGKKDNQLDHEALFQRLYEEEIIDIPAKRSDVGELSYANVAKMTPSGSGKSRSGASASESEDSPPPEWDTAPLPGDEGSNFDETLDLMAAQSQSFAVNFASLYEGAPIVMASKPPPPPPKPYQQQKQRHNQLATFFVPSKMEDKLSSSSRSGSCSSIESPSPPPNNRKVASTSRQKRRIPVTTVNGGSSSSNAPSPPPKSLPPKEKYTQKPKEKGGQNVKRQRAGAGHVPQAAINFPLPSINTKGQPNRKQKNPGPGNANRKGKSLIQQLQADRKRRLQEFYKQNKTASPETEEWPGFGLTPVTESLWDEEHEPWNLNSDNDSWSMSPVDQVFDENVDNKNKFKLNPAAPPFVSRSNTGSGEGSPTHSKAPSPPEDSSIVAWGPSTEPLEDPLAEAVPVDSGALSLSGSLFSAGIGSIWDPSKPVNTEESWGGRLFGLTDEEESGEKEI